MIYFVEGIFGAGKTTRARQLCLDQNSHENKSILYYEHEVHNMLDFTRKACLSESEFTDFVNELKGILMRKYNKEDTEQLLDKVYNNSVCIDGQRWIAWYKIGYSDPFADAFVKELHKREVCGGNVGYDTYLSIYMSVWSKYLRASDKRTNHIYEGALLHNPVIDLVGSYALPDDEVLLFYDKLQDIIKTVPVRIEYILPDSVESVLEQAAKERSDSSALWIDSLVRWSETCTYGRLHGLKGFDGAVSLCKEMIRIHRLICENISLPATIIERK